MTETQNSWWQSGYHMRLMRRCGTQDEQVMTDTDIRCLPFQFILIPVFCARLFLPRNTNIRCWPVQFLFRYWYYVPTLSFFIQILIFGTDIRCQLLHFLSWYRYLLLGPLVFIPILKFGAGCFSFIILTFGAGPFSFYLDTEIPCWPLQFIMKLIFRADPFSFYHDTDFRRRRLQFLSRYWYSVQIPSVFILVSIFQLIPSWRPKKCYWGSFLFAVHSRQCCFPPTYIIHQNCAPSLQ